MVSHQRKTPSQSVPTCASILFMCLTVVRIDGHTESEISFSALMDTGTNTISTLEQVEKLQGEKTALEQHKH